MNTRAIGRIGVVVLLASSVGMAAARAQDGAARELRPPRAPRPPTIDGRLDDEAWKPGPVELGEWLTAQPSYGQPSPQRTDVWIAYDDKALFFALRAEDATPSSLTSGVRRRDTISADDHVGIQLDPQNGRQSGVRLAVNPHGVQGDSLATVASNDWAPDWVWESAGRITADGYVVEIRVPLDSLRLAGGAEVRVPIWFWRTMTRLATVASWPDLPPGRSALDRSATLVLEGVKASPAREVIPNVTYSSMRVRGPNGASAVDGGGAIGASGRYAVGRSTAIEATVNPDFSQVESDAYQVEVNQRYPIFYSEKRPFFMQGSNLFRLARAGHDPNMSVGVHTRAIADPAWGVKLTGTSGRLTFAGLSAGDAAPGRVERGTAGAGGEKWFGVARVQYGLGAGNSVGAIVTGTAFGGRSNRVAGSDLSYRITDHQRVNGLALVTVTTDRGAPASVSGAGAAGYGYASRRLFVEAGIEHYGRDFVMDTGFYNRTGFTRGSALVEAYLYPAARALKRVSLWTWMSADRDRVAGASGREFDVGTIFTFSRQGSLVVRRLSGREPWAGMTFDRSAFQVQGSMQVAPWLSATAAWKRNHSVYYQGEPPFPGLVRDWSAGIVFEPTARLSQALRLQSVRFTALEGRDVYRVWLLNSRTTYQVTRRLAGRSTIQFDSLRGRVLLDLLASYEVKPGTVVYGGYGALAERRPRGDSEPAPGDEYVTTRRGLFLKASYLWRF